MVKIPNFYTFSTATFQELSNDVWDDLNGLKNTCYFYKYGPYFFDIVVSLIKYWKYIYTFCFEPTSSEFSVRNRLFFLFLLRIILRYKIRVEHMIWNEWPNYHWCSNIDTLMGILSTNHSHWLYRLTAMYIVYVCLLYYVNYRLSIHG